MKIIVTGTRGIPDVMGGVETLVRSFFRVSQGGGRM